MAEIEYEFKGRCPSKTQVIKSIQEGIKHGAYSISVSWGENWLEVEKNQMNGTWYGQGWIRRISGSDIAEELV